MIECYLETGRRGIIALPLRNAPPFGSHENVGAVDFGAAGGQFESQLFRDGWIDSINTEHDDEVRSAGTCVRGEAMKNGAIQGSVAGLRLLGEAHGQAACGTRSLRDVKSHLVGRSTTNRHIVKFEPAVLSHDTLEKRTGRSVVELEVEAGSDVGYRAISTWRSRESARCRKQKRWGSPYGREARAQDRCHAMNLQVFGLEKKLSQFAGRDVNFMIFGDVGSATNNPPEHHGVVV